MPIRGLVSQIRNDPQIDSAIEYTTKDGRPGIATFQDQGAFLRAIDEWERTPFILPLNWNFRPTFHRSFFGPIKIWHAYEDPSLSFMQLVEYYRSPNTVIQFHQDVTGRGTRE